MSAHDHYHVPREPRFVLMADREIAEISRCYRCGGHHVARFPRSAHRAGHFAAVVAAIAAVVTCLVLVAVL